MTRSSPIQESFAYGEIGERLRSRVSIDPYKEGLKRARNWYPLVQGPIRMREGSKFMEPVDPNNWTSDDVSTAGLRVVTFQRDLDQDVIFEIGTNKFIARDSDTGQQLTGGVTGNLITDSQYTLAIPGAVWTFDNCKYDFNGGEPAIFTGPFNPGTPDAYIKINGTLHQGNNDFCGGALESASSAGVIIPSGSELLLNTVTIPVTAFLTLEQIIDWGPLPITNLQVRIVIGTTPGASDIQDITNDIETVYVPFNVVLGFTPGAGNNLLYLSVGWEWTNGAIPAGTGGGVHLDVGEITWTAPLSGGSGSAVEFPSVYTAEQLECLQYTMDPGEKVMVLTHPNVEPQYLTYDPVLAEYSLDPISSVAGFVAPTGSTWSTEDYPAACVFHEGRLYLGGSPSFPSTIWASRSGVYVDFDNAGAATKADPLLFPLSSAGTIKTLSSRKELVINGNISEIVGTSVQGVIAFDDFAFPKQTDWGSNCVQPMLIGRDMIYTSNSRKKVRTFADEGGTNFGWDGNELSLLAEEIFETPIRRMVYLDEPGYQACFLLADGTLGMATYYYPEKAIGWWRYTTVYNGAVPNSNPIQLVNNVMDITKINTSQGAKLWMLINRIGFSGTTKVGHELLGFDTGLKAALDSYAVRIPNENRQLTDIDELTGQICSVIIEQFDTATGKLYWTVHPPVLVTIGVSAALEEWAIGGTCYIGLFYENDFQLLSLEGVNPRGTSQTMKRRWHKVFARLNNSPVPLIEGVAAKDRTPATPMGLGEPFLTGDTEIVDLGSGEGDLFFTQDKPLITEVTGIFGRVSSAEV